jgi:glucosamine-phosphate N-acetyltransferase
MEMKACKYRVRELLLMDLDDNYFSLLCELSGENRTLKNNVVKSCWNEYTNNLNYCTFVCEDTPDISLQPHLISKIIGTASVLIEHKMLHYGSKVGHIEDVVVANRTRVKGIGRTLVEKCVEFCKTNNCYKVILNCSNENIPFYENCGFRVSDNCMRIDLQYDF